jgi:hypothetical protein
MIQRPKTTPSGLKEEDHKKLVIELTKYAEEGASDSELKQFREAFISQKKKSIQEQKSPSESNIPQKQKKFALDSSSEDGSLVSQKSPKPNMPVLTQEGFEQAMSKKKAVPTDMSGKALMKPASEIKKIKEKAAVLKGANKKSLETESPLEGAYPQAPLSEPITTLVTGVPGVPKIPTLTETIGVPTKKIIEQEYKDLDLDNPAPYLSASTYNRQPVNGIAINKDNFIEEVFTDEKLINLGIDPADFDGYLNLSGYKEDYNKRKDRGDFEVGSVENPKLNEELYKSKLLSNYVRTKNDREVLKSKLQSVKASYEGKKIPVNKNAKALDNNLIAKYTEENLPVLYKKLKEKDQLNKEKYKELTEDNTGLNSFAIGAKNTLRSALNGFVDSVNKASATVYDALGADDLAEDLRYLNEERQLERPSERQVSFASGKVVDLAGKKYLVDEKGTVYDKDNEIVVNDLIEEGSLNKILEEAKKSKEEDWFFSPQGTAVQTGSVLGDMVWQVAYQASIGRVTKGLGKLSIPKSTADAIIAQSSLGYAQAYQTTLKEARDAGLTDKEAEQIAGDAAQRTAIWYGMTAPISPQTKAVESLFGSAEKELIKKAVGAYKTQGKQSFISTLNNGLKQISKKTVGFVEEGGKEVVQENIQQAGESLWINAQKNIEAGREISDETMSFDDFVNTSILSFASGGLVSNLSMPSLPRNKKTQVRDLYQLSQNIDVLDTNLNEMVNNNIISKEDAENVKKDAIAVSRNITRIPKDTNPEVQLDVMRKLSEIEDLENSKNTLDKSFHSQIDEKIQEKRNEVKEIYDISLTTTTETDAVQEQSTTEVPVQSEAITSETLETGVPQPGPEVFTEQVTQEEVDNRPITERQSETESKIKRKDLFQDGGTFSNILGESGVDSVPTNHREINGIEFVEFSNPNSGVVDVIMSGTSDSDFVGFYRIYENGKPTDKWSSKFENQSRNKENFKTMISGVQEMLPEGHEYTEKTSISTDGLRVWEQQLSRGYEIQTDENGNIVTNEVAINGDAIVNELGIDVNQGNFDNISVTNNQQFEIVKKALIPYLEKLGLTESNIKWENGTVKIDLPVLKKSTTPSETITTEQVKTTPVVEETAPVEKTKIYHGGQIQDIDSISDTEPLFVTQDKDEAVSYAKGNDGNVSVAEIDISKIGSEDVARDILKDMGYSDEYMLHELIDPRFEDSYIGDENVKKLYTEIEKQGYVGISFMDTGIGNKKNVTNIFLINPKQTLKDSGLNNNVIVREKNAYDLLEEGFNPVIDGNILENITEDELGEFFRNSETIEMTKSKPTVTPTEVAPVVEETAPAEVDKIKSDIEASKERLKKAWDKYKTMGIAFDPKSNLAKDRELVKALVEYAYNNIRLGSYTASKLIEDLANQGFEMTKDGAKFIMDRASRKVQRDIDKTIGIKPKATEQKRINKAYSVGVATQKVATKEAKAEVKDLKGQVVDVFKAGIEAVKIAQSTAKEKARAIKTKSEELAKYLDELKGAGKITANQATAMVKRFSKVNVLSEKSVNRFIDYTTKVLNDADYNSKLTEARKTLSSLKKLSKDTEKNADLRVVASEFVKIDPSMVENIDEYNDIANKLKTAVEGSKIRKANTKIVDTVNIDDVNTYVEKILTEQETKLRDEKITEIQSLFGVDAKDFSAEEIDALLESDEDIADDDAKIVRATLNKAFDVYSTVIDEMLKTGVDPFTGEDVEFTNSQKKIIKDFMGIDLDTVTDNKDALRIIDSLINFIQNKSTAGMLKPIADFQAIVGGNELIRQKIEGKGIRKFWSPSFGKTLAEQFTSLNLLFEKEFKGFNAASKVRKMMGITDLVNGKSIGQSEANRIVKKYVEQFYNKTANGEEFNSAYNDIERGVFAHVYRSVIGTEQRKKAVFEKRKQEVLDAIAILEKNGNKEEKQLAELYKKAYDKILDGSENINDVQQKTDANNVDGVNYWVNQWADKFDALSDLALNFYNKILNRDLGYTPDRFKRLQGETKEIDLENDESAFISNTDKVLYNKKSGSLMDKQENRKTPKGMFIDLSFDSKNSNSMYDALIDLNTAFNIRKVQSFLKSDNFNKIFKDDADLFKKRIASYVRLSRRKSPYTGSELSGLIQKLDKAATIGVTQALASPTQPFKQIIPVMASTAINAGSLGMGSAFNPSYNNWLNKLGYAISNRGIESRAEIEAINRLLEKAASSKKEKVVGLVREANEKMLKWTLVNPDVWIARASFKAYYEQYLKKEGLYNDIPKKQSRLGITEIDYDNHEPNDDAADYAQEMIDRQQNISDYDLAGDLFTDKNSITKAFIKMLMAFSSFRMNQGSRLGADLTTLEYWNTSTNEDKWIALRSIAGYTAEQAVFRGLQITFGMMFYYGAKALMGRGDDEEEDKKFKNNLIKASSTGAITDTFSPLPLLDPYVQNLSASSVDAVQDIINIPEKDKIKLFESNKQEAIKTLGVYGIVPERAGQLWDLGKLAYTRKFKDNYGREKEISQKDADALKVLIGPYLAASVTGVLAPDISSLVRKSIKIAEKGSKKGSGTRRVMSQEEYDRLTK